VATHRIMKRVYDRIEKERHSFSSPNCCNALSNGLMEKNSIYVYSPNHREYGLVTGCMIMDYCIHCSTRMPDSLRRKWFFILQAKYKLSNQDIDNEKIAPEFLTDEWWKKRNIPSRLSYLSKRERDNTRQRKRRNGCFCLNGKELNKYCQIDLIYNTRFREYGIKTVQQRGPYLVMNYCLWCSRQLEPSLRNLWAKLLQKEHGIANPFEIPIAQLPKSFRTDEWWKRRGL